jgi:hypothetical protein
MRVAAENYKGIEYIRISSLPSEQKKNIYQSLNHKLIINILREESLLNDCLQYQHYITWYENVFKNALQEKSVEVQANVQVLTLAFK